jgi:hypothetical protein
LVHVCRLDGSPRIIHGRAHHRRKLLTCGDHALANHNEPKTHS